MYTLCINYSWNYVMYYRRKIILALLERFGGTLGKTDFQKYLFLFSMQQKKPTFEFIPYKYGGFSWQSYADINTMIKYKQIDDNNSWVNTVSISYLNALTPNDREAIDYVHKKYGKIHGNRLLKTVYKKYPYYAIKSEIARKILNDDEYDCVIKEKPHSNDDGVFSIGYEGRSFENYLNALIRENINALVDVRRNALSMKYGFSKKQLQNGLESVGIEYHHFPRLGIASEKRKRLLTQDDYDDLFCEYRKTVLNENKQEVEKIIGLIREKHRIAITCFEINPHRCHRTCVADAVCSHHGVADLKFQVKNL